MRRFRWSSLAMVLLAAAVCGVEGQTLEGVLLDRATELPVPLGELVLLTIDGDSIVSTLTDEQGRFSLRSPESGEFLMRSRALGYESSIVGVFTLGEDASMSVEYRLDPLPVEIEGISFEARRRVIESLRQPKLIQNGFVARALKGFGRFITPADIEQLHAYNTTELLARTNRISLQASSRGTLIRMLGRGGYCAPRLYLDGLPLTLGNQSLDAVVPVRAIEAAEVYRNPVEAPIEYGGGMSGGCGVVLLWTKAR